MRTNLFCLALTFFSFPAAAGTFQFQGCRSEIAIEVFIPCTGGEGGAQTPCGSQTTNYGTLTADLKVDSQTKNASASVEYSPLNGTPKKMATSCTLGRDNWMDCTTTEALPILGKLIISFNIDGIKTGVYFSDIFSEATNVPVGAFQTDLNCTPARIASLPLAPKR